MAYWLPRTVIVLIALATTCVLVNMFTSIDPLVFYVAGGVWSLVGLASFSAMDKLPGDEDALRIAALARIRQRQPAK
jgi:hypothetical protein